MTAEEAQSRLSYLFPLLHKVWKVGFDRHLANCNHPDLTRVTRAGILQNFAIGEMKRALLAMRGHYFCERDQREILVVQDVALVAFKKLSDQLHANSQQTNGAESFYEQQPLPGLPELPHLLCGPVLNSNWTEIMSIHLVSPRSYRSNSWTLDIKDTGEGDAYGNQFPLPEPIGPTIGFTPKRKPADDAHQAN